MDSYAIINFQGELPKDVFRDDIKEALEIAFKDCGKMTGEGSGIYGYNLDIEFDDNKVQSDKVFEIIKEVLLGFNLSVPITINIGKLYELNQEN